MATLDCHGRIADRTILQALGWPTGHRLTIHETDGRLTVVPDLVTTLRPAPEEMRGVVAALGSRVDGLVRDAGWSGHAADSFRQAWTADSVAAGTLSEVVGGVGDTLVRLAGSLDILERAQREAAETAQSAGVSVEADGSVRPFVSVVPAGATAAPEVTEANVYAREVQKLPLQQIWLDHLLALQLRINPRNDGWDTGTFVLLYPVGDLACAPLRQRVTDAASQLATRSTCARSTRSCRLLVCPLQIPGPIRSTPATSTPHRSTPRS